MATITQFFTNGNDSFTVNTPDAYQLGFLNGNDTLVVNLGTTLALMGEGNDFVRVNAGLATIYGDGGADRIDIYASNATVQGGSGNDLVNIRGGSGLDAFGEIGDDRFSFLVGVSSVTLHGGIGNDDFLGFNHAISGSIHGDDGNDFFGDFRGPSVTLSGGTGNDVYRLHATSPATFVENAGEGTDSVQVPLGKSYTLLPNFENISVQGLAGSTAGAATLTGNAAANALTGHNNAETLVGLEGNDRLFGNAANDVLHGGSGQDHLDGGTGSDTLNGNAGNDVLNGRTGDDIMRGRDGNDTFYVDSLSDVVTENLNEGTDVVRISISGFSLPGNVENGITVGAAVSLAGNGLNNQLTGNNADNELSGLEGDDFLRGGGGDDNLDGEVGDDRIDGGIGGDNMIGGQGNDTYFVDSFFDNIVEDITVTGGVDTVHLNMVNPDLLSTYNLHFVVENLVIISGPASVVANSRNNIITSSDQPGEINAGAGDDTIIGGDAGQTLQGGDGLDTINGAGGNDMIFGETNLSSTPQGDVLTGGPGNDLFGYSQIAHSAPFLGRVDQITDFESGFDTISLTMDANANIAGVQDWALVGAPSGAAGELWIVVADAASQDYVLFGDSDGVDGADFMVRLHAPNGFFGSDIFL